MSFRVSNAMVTQYSNGLAIQVMSILAIEDWMLSGLRFSIGSREATEGLDSFLHTSFDLK